MPHSALTPPRLLRRAGALLAAAVFWPVALAAAPPTIAFELHAVVVSDLAPGSEAVLHGVTRERHAYLWRLVTAREVLAADATGTARLDLPDGVGPISTWTAVDVVTGDFSIASPKGFAPEELLFPADGLGQSALGAWQVVRSHFERAEVLYVRPGTGAWWLVAVDGSGSDEDGRDDSALTASLEHAQPLWGDQPPPEQFAEGDVAVVVGLDTLDFFAARLVAPPGSAQ